MKKETIKAINAVLNKRGLVLIEGKDAVILSLLSILGGYTFIYTITKYGTMAIMSIVTKMMKDRTVSKEDVEDLIKAVDTSDEDIVI